MEIKFTNTQNNRNKMITEGINTGINYMKKGIAISRIEELINNKSFHKIAAIIKKEFPRKEKLNKSEIEFIIGKLREYELTYAKQIKEREKGQTKLVQYVT